MAQLKPEFLEMLRQLKSDFGVDAIDRLIDALQSPEPVIGARVNPLKGVVRPEGARPVGWCSDGFYIGSDRPKFTFDPHLHQGLYYVQNPSSMSISAFVKAVTDPDRPCVYIDACAAPGGKTTAAISSLPKGSLIIANEFDSRRAEILRENVIKWGYPSVVITCGDTARFRKLREVADIVAIDAPCSGEGMMRKDETAVEQWSRGLVESCASLQREIIDNLWDTLRPGGFMIYSTCTFNRLEDEENLRYIIESLGGESIEVSLPDNQGIMPAIGSEYHASRFIPGLCDGEGLFIALIRKPGENAPRKTSSKSKSSKPNPLVEKARQWVENPESFLFTLDGDTITAVPTEWQSLISDISKKIKTLYIATEIATVKGRDLIPAHALAMSTILKRGAFPEVEVDYPTAIAYLRRESITLSDAPSGIILLTYKGLPLGFAKNLGNRANNLYPAPWSIRSPHIPSTPPQILSLK